MPNEDTNTNSTPVTDAPMPVPTGGFDEAPAGSAAADATPAADAADNSDDNSRAKETDAEAKERSAAIMSEVANRISEAHNILIALSSDPSVDELAAAIGLSICLDRVGKRATAIYSGSTPNALEFLKPEETFETTADTLQDFVIALSKDKADHLRYKLDGDYVRIFITPYKSRISEEDLEFTYGDFNIDLVVSLDVTSGTDLDAALREHGRIMHDATVINITTGNPGKFGEIEWSDKGRSSVSEMVASLLYAMGKKVPMESEEATAFLTGIVAATNRFSNASTTSEALHVAAQLMASGANQQLVTENITADMDNRMFNLGGDFSTSRETGPEELAIDHTEEEPEDLEILAAEDSEPDLGPSSGAVEADSAPDELSEVAASLAEPSAAQSSAKNDENLSENGAGFQIPTAGEVGVVKPQEGIIEQPEKIVAPSADFTSDNLGEGTNRYGQMLEEALAEDAAATTPIATPIMSEPGLGINPAASMAPEVASAPEINGVPEINYNAGGDGVLPPPPTPPIDFNAGGMMPPETIPAPASAPVPENTGVEAPMSETLAPEAPIPETPTLEAPAETQAPDAFKIPGM